MSRFRGSLGYALSLPGNTVRAASTGLGGPLNEETQVMLPGRLRRSCLYCSIVTGTLRIGIELTGGAAEISRAQGGAHGRVRPHQRTIVHFE